MFKNINKILKETKEKVNAYFSQKEITKIAKETKFVSRSTSRLKGTEYISAFIAMSSQGDLATLDNLCRFIQELNPGVKLSKQALFQRIHSESSVKFLREIYKGVFSIKMDEVSKGLRDQKLFKRFNNVYIEDSTIINITEFKSEEMLNSKNLKSTGGTAKPCALKINVFYELNTRSIKSIKQRSGNYSDAKSGEDTINRLKKDDLILRDLGYFKINNFKEMINRGAYFLSRLKGGVRVCLNKEDKEAIKLSSFLHQQLKKDIIVDKNIFIGEEKLPVRLIATKLSPRQAEIRKRRIKRAAEGSSKGRMRVSTENYNLQNYSIFITNVSAEIWPKNIIGIIYRERWQIELVFKNWKSFHNLRMVKGSSENRIKSLIYGMLICVCLTMKVFSLLEWVARTSYKKEISLDKLSKLLLFSNKLAIMSFKGFTLKFLNYLISEIKILCKEKRTRKTTREMLQQQINSCDYDDQKFMLCA